MSSAATYLGYEATAAHVLSHEFSPRQEFEEIDSQSPFPLEPIVE
jgi:hypothetical protein